MRCQGCSECFGTTLMLSESETEAKFSTEAHVSVVSCFSLLTLVSNSNHRAVCLIQLRLRSPNHVCTHLAERLGNVVWKSQKKRMFVLWFHWCCDSFTLNASSVGECVTWRVSSWFWIMNHSLVYFQVVDLFVLFYSWDNNTSLWH